MRGFRQEQYRAAIFIAIIPHLPFERERETETRKNYKKMIIKKNYQETREVDDEQVRIKKQVKQPGVQESRCNLVLELYT